MKYTKGKVLKIDIILNTTEFTVYNPIKTMICKSHIINVSLWGLHYHLGENKEKSKE